ncbi:hypothetical protein CP987_19340, partial [Morganella morganii]
MTVRILPTGKPRRSCAKAVAIVPEGRLIGANGAGKTTLLGTLCGDPRASSGRIVFDGKDITDWQTAKIMR